jgi:hypothetical protein
MLWFMNNVLPWFNWGLFIFFFVMDIKIIKLRKMWVKNLEDTEELLKLVKKERGELK